MNELKINKEIFETLINISKEDLIACWINEDFFEIIFAIDLSEEINNEINRILDFYKIVPEEKNDYEFVAQWYKETTTNNFKLGYGIYFDDEDIEIDELVGSKLDDFVMDIIKKEIENLKEE